MYHVAVVTMTEDGKISADGLNFPNNRPTKVTHIRGTFCYERLNTKNAANQQLLTASVSIGLYTPIHPEAIAWSRTTLLNLYGKTILSLRAPRGTDWGHYSPNDTVCIISVDGADADFRIMMCLEAWALYGPPTHPGKKSRVEAGDLPELTPLHRCKTISSQAGPQQVSVKHHSSGSEDPHFSSSYRPTVHSPEGSEDSTMSVVLV